jgi:asparagine synthase (glutamine-hydrolysing)
VRLICGIWHLDGRPADRETVDAMCAAMQSAVRPATTQMWAEGSAGLGVLDFASLPAVLHPGRNGTMLAADVRLDDPADLRRGYGLDSSATDPQIALAALEQPNSESVRSLEGEFALALWSPGERRLLLARDAMGIRPLYLHYEPGKCLIFASLPAGIFASGLVPRTLDEAGLGAGVLRAYQPGGTIFSGVRSVLPGHTVEVTESGLRETCYWRPEAGKPLQISRADAAVRLRELIQNAVTSAVGSTGPAATHLSGGLDSSSLAVIAARALRAQSRPLFAYSFLPEVWPGIEMEDETPFVEAVLQQEPDIHWKPIRQALPQGWQHDSWSADGPLSLADDSPENAILLDASQQGANVILSGWGGDEGITFNGRGALAAAFRRVRWGYLARELQALRKERGFPLRNILIGDVLHPQISHKTMVRLRRLTGSKPLPTVMEPEFLSASLLERMADFESEVALGPDPLQNQLALLRSAHITFRATNFAIMAARYGLAFSFPLLNRKVVEFALSLPPTWHVHKGWKRSLFRDAMDGILPPSIQWRHTKLVPLPSILYEFAQGRAGLLQRIQQLEKHPIVSQLFDLQRIKAAVLAMPEPAAVTNPALEDGLKLVPSLAHTLHYAFYVEQHF